VRLPSASLLWSRRCFDSSPREFDPWNGWACLRLILPLIVAPERATLMVTGDLCQPRTVTFRRKTCRLHQPTPQEI